MSRKGSGSQKSVRPLTLSPLNMQWGDPLPEEWTLVGVHKMEKREPFQLWYSDLQANILNCARKINCLLEEHPHPNADVTKDDLAYSRYVIENERNRVMGEVLGRQPPNTNPIFFKLAREEEIRLYKGL
ncbi:uncharacterized protein LOC143453299 [Clavelina lepadiformis]|uniref:uncharacterized protein LOC143453299 n=1 Tax=Clavelina lepadiformis TaxID=159417 RepID=UPI0040418EB0